MLEFVLKKYIRRNETGVSRELMATINEHKNLIVQDKMNTLFNMIKNKEVKVFDFDKNEKFKKIFLLLENYLKREFKRIDVFTYNTENIHEINPDINKDRIFILEEISKENWNKIIGEKEENGIVFGAFSDLGYLVINWKELKKRGGDDNNFKLFCTLVHELIHSKSFERYVVVNSGIKEGKYKFFNINKIRRSGYNTVNKYNKFFPKRFSSFNEAITERVTRDFFSENKEILKKIFGFSEEDLNNYIKGDNLCGCYNYELRFLHRLIKAIAQRKDVSYQKILDDFKRGYFSGQTNVLKNLKEIWGPGAVKVLALIDEKESGNLIKATIEKFQVSQEFLDLFNGLEDGETR